VIVKYSLNECEIYTEEIVAISKYDEENCSSPAIHTRMIQPLDLLRQHDHCLYFRNTITEALSCSYHILHKTAL
jgi:hypothetical protein